MSTTPSLHEISDGCYQLRGELTLNTVPQLAQALSKVSAKTITVSFAEVTVADSAAVALMLAWKRQMQQQGKALEYSDLSEYLLDLIQLYEVDPMIL